MVTTGDGTQYLPLSKVLAVGVGNALEFYDFLTFSFFAIQIGHCFFPTGATTHGLLFSLATFGVGFVTRPLGGLIIGGYGDRVGRKPAMMLSFALMGIAITGVALTPSYASIGMAAPILLILFRLMQGFALGGEVGPSTAFLIEAAPPHRRGIYVAVQYATQDLAVLVAGLVGFGLSSTLSAASLDSWGWRLAFLLGAAIVPAGLMMRRSLPETLYAAESDTTVPAGRRVPRRLIVLGFMMLMATTISTYVLDYVTTYAQDTLHMTTTLAFGATIVAGLASVFADPLAGLISDRIGRKPVMLTATTTMLILALPAYLVMTRFPSVGIVYAATFVLNALLSFSSGPALITITEALPKAVRSGVLATLYALAIATFGGTTQFVIKELIDLTGSPLAPAFYLTAALLIGAVAMVMIQETSPVRLTRPYRTFPRLAPNEVP